MYCGNCGEWMEDGAVFCGNCGAQVEASMLDMPAAPGAPGGGLAAKTGGLSKKQWAIIGGGAGGLVILILAIVLIVRLVGGGGGYKQPVKDLFSGLNNIDSEKVVTALLGGTEYQEDIDEMDRDDWEDLDEDLEDWLDDQSSKGVSYDYDITSAERLTGDDLDDWISDIRPSYLYRHKSDVEDVYELKLTLTVTTGSRDKDYKIKNLYAVKYDGVWSLYVGRSNLPDYIPFLYNIY